MSTRALERAVIGWNRSRLDLDSDEVLAQVLDRGDLAAWRELYTLAASDPHLRRRILGGVARVPLPCQSRIRPGRDLLSPRRDGAPPLPESQAPLRRRRARPRKAPLGPLVSPPVLPVEPALRNYSGLAHSDRDGAVAPNIGRVFDYPLMSFDEQGEPVYGVLATDRPHQLKAHVLFDFAFGTSVGLRWFGASGIPRTRQAAFVPSQEYPVFYRGRLSDGRLPFLSQLDVYVQHQVRIGKRLRLTLSANAINLLNQGAATNYFPSELFPG